MTKLQKFFVYATLLILSVPQLLPLLWMISTSLKSEDQVYSKSGATGTFSFASMIPHPIAWNNYPDSLNTMPFMLYLRNTLMLCAVIVVASVVSSSIVAYGFARLKFVGSNVWFFVMLSTMALPAQVTMIPIFSMYRSLGWYGTYLPLIVPSFCGSPFYFR